MERRTALPRSGPLRYLSYVARAARALRHLPLPRVRVAVDGECLAEDAAVAIAANVLTYGGFLNLTPLACSLDDLMNVCLAALLHLPSGRTAIVRRGTRVSLEADGEVPEEIFLDPEVLPVLAPPAGRTLASSSVPTSIYWGETLRASPLRPPGKEWGVPFLTGGRRAGGRGRENQSKRGLSGAGCPGRPVRLTPAPSGA